LTNTKKMNIHKTTIHAKCPLNGSWDYYTVLIETDEFIACEQIEELCDFVRGKSAEQERIAQDLHRSLGVKNKLTLLGRHGQNTELKVVIE
jgi:hypothetical protein